MAETEPETPAKPVSLKNVDARIVERLGIATVLVLMAGYHFFGQDSSKQDYIQTQASENAAAIKEQAKLDREREKQQTQFMQEKLIAVVESQVTATVAQTEASKATAITNTEVAEKLGDFVDVSEKMVERFDEAIDRIESRPTASEPSQ
jgi:ABC-type transporter MlaC component